MNFDFADALLKASECMKEKLIFAPVIIGPDWVEPFEVMRDASGNTLGVVLGQKHNRIFHQIYYDNKSMNGAQKNYNIQELLVVLYVFEKFRAYLLGTRVIVHIDYAGMRYFMANKDTNLRLIKWVMLQEFDFEVKDKRGCENQVPDQLYRLEAQKKEELELYINYLFPDEKVLAAALDPIPWFY